ncbi:hypothetical protein T05_823 [Trichinella murrelli]|uniref:Secreted protein n=1 Tax=Trichinella murrelli TaxID=144512 RepID=A0A0V0TME7_9BILA|nr:hypothetical protein T05_823 [Trichinella murrelli]
MQILQLRKICLLLLLLLQKRDCSLWNEFWKNRSQARANLLQQHASKYDDATATANAAAAAAVLQFANQQQTASSTTVVMMNNRDEVSSSKRAI